METLVGMFPGLDRGRLSTALEAHNGDVERAANYLLMEGAEDASRTAAPRGTDAATLLRSAQDAPDADMARILQMEEDERLAARMQQEEMRRSAARQRAPNAASAGGELSSWSLPSASDLTSAIGPVVEQVKTYAYQAYESAVRLVNDYMAPDSTTERNYLRLTVDDADSAGGAANAQVLHSSRDPASEGSVQRHYDAGATRRRTGAGVGAFGPADSGVKKDE
ncbi:hypothetical protein FVE85_8079 [Porphyridium purpureum]|uniref:CUE domain-containing protein n=1 Tax=Porphyridium purpureum TaxID=35688 RepID=A0A5J4YNN2_PORPP|nr:hypothetical protein FVE85_8079 [Porphyridium purpureum]|eukprot:POR5997..scf295_9